MGIGYHLTRVPDQDLDSFSAEQKEEETSNEAMSQMIERQPVSSDDAGCAWLSEPRHGHAYLHRSLDLCPACLECTVLPALLTGFGLRDYLAPCWLHVQLEEGHGCSSVWLGSGAIVVDSYIY